MREIKFRVWDDVLGIREVDEISFCGGFCSVADEHETYELNLDNLMQYTGLKDRYDIEYCQDDIFIDGRTGYKYKVIKDIAAFWGEPTEPELMAEDYCKTLLCNINVMSEIIGNIHENPELME